jgi:predicted RNase H-like HicB family nuclease
VKHAPTTRVPFGTFYFSGSLLKSTPEAATQATTRPINLTITVRLSAVVHPEPQGGFSAEVPALPGCFTEAETLEELQANLVEAAEAWLEAEHTSPLKPRS